MLFDQKGHGILCECKFHVKIMAVWDVTLHSLVYGTKLLEEHTASIFRVENRQWR